MIVKKPNDKPLIIVVVVIVLCLLCGAIYFVGGVSATTPPIRQYKFDGSANQLKKGLYNQLKSDTTLEYKDEEIWGNEKDGYSYRATIDQCKNGICNKYTIRYEDEKPDSRFSLISAFDVRI